MVAGHHVCIVSFSCMVLGRDDWIILNLFYVCCHALTSNMLLLQKAVHASTALDGPAGRTCHCSEIYCIDLQSIYRLNVLPSCSGPGDGSLLVPPSLSNVSRPGLGHFTLLHFTLFLVLPASADGHQIHSTATAGTTFNDSIYSIHFLASLLILLSLWFILLMFALNGFLSPSYTCPRKANHNVVQEPQQRWQQTVVDSENLSGGAKVKASAVPPLYSTGVFSRFQSSG